MSILKPKKCKYCKELFTPVRPLQYVCSPTCGYELQKKQKEKSWNKEKKVLKEKLMSRSDWLNILQKVFNTYIRLRDKDKPCISCGKRLNNKYDAGHYYSMGNYSFLRFNEENTHGQCVHCNRDLHGNLIEYRRNLIGRIGSERVEILDENRHNKLELSVEQIKELINKYKLKIKQHD